MAAVSPNQEGSAKRPGRQSGSCVCLPHPPPKDPPPYFPRESSVHVSGGVGDGLYSAGLTETTLLSAPQPSKSGILNTPKVLYFWSQLHFT